MGHPEQAGAEAVGHPDVALTVDVQTAIEKPGLEVLGFGRIGHGEARDIGAAVRNPDPVLLVDGEVKRPGERLAWLGILALADQPTLGPIAVGEVHELLLPDAERPHVTAAGHNDDALHFSELPPKRDPLWRRQRLAVLVEHGDRLAPVTRRCSGRPDMPSG